MCYTCQLVARRDQNEAPIWDNIHRTPYWDVVHSYNSALLGWTVLVLRRHLEALDALTETEAVDLGRLIRRVSIGLKQLTGCQKTYVIQFAEDPLHPHVHFHVVPRMPDQPEEFRSGRVFNYLTQDESSRLSPDALEASALKMQPFLTDP